MGLLWLGLSDEAFRLTSGRDSAQPLAQPARRDSQTAKQPPCRGLPRSRERLQRWSSSSLKPHLKSRSTALSTSGGAARLAPDPPFGRTLSGFRRMAERGSLAMTPAGLARAAATARVLLRGAPGLSPGP